MPDQVSGPLRTQDGHRIVYHTCDVPSHHHLHPELNLPEEYNTRAYCLDCGWTVHTTARYGGMHDFLLAMHEVLAMHDEPDLPGR